MPVTVHTACSIVVDNTATSSDDAGDDGDDADAGDEVVVKIELTMALGNILASWIATIVCKRETGKEGKTRPKSAIKAQFGENSETMSEAVR